MGRKKLRIVRLECGKARQVKYSKRKIGVLKKAKELATLCDVDVAVIMFSPTGKPSHFVAQDKDFSSILEKLASLSMEDREQRRAHTMRLLKKAYARIESGVGARNQALDRCEALMLHKDELKGVKEKLAEKRRILRNWKNPYNVDDLLQIKIMEDHLNAMLHKVKDLKIQLMEQQKQA